MRTEFGWKKSTACDMSSGNCVEVSAFPGAVAIRDGKRPEADALVFTTEEWSAFVAGAKAGEFDVT
jgi:hypothetical protein